LPLESGPSTAAPAAPVELVPESSMVADTVALQHELERERVLLIDARAANRFAGRDENLDPVAGHVPGAINRPFADNLGDRGRFRSVEALGAEFRRLLSAHDPSVAVHMCGSGVTACHNLLAMELAGLTGARLYAGSWSEWIRDPSRPVAEGPA
jgi:thiosulfate/3-mercaptopyruvate sulfurtransferase